MLVLLRVKKIPTALALLCIKVESKLLPLVLCTLADSATNFKRINTTLPKPSVHCYLYPTSTLSLIFKNQDFNRECLLREKRSLFLAKEHGASFWSTFFKEKTIEEDLHERRENKSREVLIYEYKL